jgi:hypothetical protein
MSPRRRRALLFALLPALALPGPVQAACPVQPCVDLAQWVDTGGGPGNGDGVLCEYLKLYAPPPSDWEGDPKSPPPYVFTRTEAWGNTWEHRQYYDWDSRGCIPACPVLSGDLDPAALPSCGPWVEG